TLEELGLLKMDFLGLRTLTVIQNAVQMARRKAPELDIEKIDYNDQAVMDYIGTGKTDGIFQIESSGMKSFMKELKPHSLEDIIAGIALYRPGPMDFKIGRASCRERVVFSVVVGFVDKQKITSTIGVRTSCDNVFIQE